MTPKTTAPSAPACGPQPDQVNVRAVVLVGIVLAVFVLVLHLPLALLMRTFRGERPPPSRPAQMTAPGGAEHWRDPDADIARLRAREQVNLNSLDWMDRRRGQVRIPIDDAMKLLVRSRKEQRTDWNIKTLGEEFHDDATP